jgi:FkbM family methyltransferase
VPLQRSLTFAIREVRRGGRVGYYELRDTGAIACLRHDGHDAWVLHEVFGKRCYEPPREAAAILAREPQPKVVDVGAHAGFFGLFVLDRYADAHLIALEPDPGNAALLDECIRRNGRTEQWELLRACASIDDGYTWFAQGRGERSHMTRERAPGTTKVPMVDLFTYLDDVTLLKMDIEGGEWPILADSRLARAAPRVIVLEYHGHGCPDSDPRAAAKRQLEEFGYVVEHSNASAAPDVGLLWAWHTAPSTAGRAPADRDAAVEVA